VAIGLREPPEVEQCVAEREVRHRVAGLQAAQPAAQRLLPLRLDRRAEQLAVDGPPVAVQGAGRDEDGVRRDVGETESGDVEARLLPQLGVLGIVRVVGRGILDDEPDAASLGFVVEQTDVVADAEPAVARLAVVDAPELERAEEAEAGFLAEMEARQGW